MMRGLRILFGDLRHQGGLEVANLLGIVTAIAMVFAALILGVALAGPDPRPPADASRPNWCREDYICRSLEQERQQQHVVSDLIAALDECRATKVKKWGACYGLGVSVGLDPDDRCEGADCSTAYTWQVMPAASFIWGRRP
jgi:hypothetical protein